MLKIDFDNELIEKYLKKYVVTKMIYSNKIKEIVIVPVGY